jgi:hypothetical protein
MNRTQTEFLIFLIILFFAIANILVGEKPAKHRIIVITAAILILLGGVYHAMTYTKRGLRHQTEPIEIKK